jgi:hypothetical protein
MIVVYAHVNGANEFEFLEPFAKAEKLNDILFTISQLLANRGKDESVQLLANFNFQLSKGTNRFSDNFLVLHTIVPIEVYEKIRTESEKANQEGVESIIKVRKPYSDIAHVMEELGYFVRFITFGIDTSAAPEDWRSYFNNSNANNQALFDFKDNEKLSFQGLNFRSKAEIKIYEALLKKGLLIMPLPVMVMGANKNYKEPDFVVCYNNRIGILDVQGKQFHPPELAATIYEKRREFIKLGVSLYEVFDAKRCYQDPDGVVDDFIQAFKQQLH